MTRHKTRSGRQFGANFLDFDSHRETKVKAQKRAKFLKSDDSANRVRVVPTREGYDIYAKRFYKPSKIRGHKK